jgi:hypothetical protein
LPQPYLELNWQLDRLHVRSGGQDWNEVRDLPARKSAFRAILARFAALCNVHNPGSCTPYGGCGELTLGSDNTIFQVAFTNTPTEQRLELRPKPTSASYPVGVAQQPVPAVQPKQDGK